MSTTPRRKNKLVLALFVAAAAAAVAAFLFNPRLSDDRPSAEAAATATAGTTDGVPAQPAAETSSAPYTIEPEPTEVATEAPVEDSDGNVLVVLTYAGQDESTGVVQANGYVRGVIEEGGTCSLTLTRGDTEVIATTNATADATTTSCGLLETSPDLAAGTWEAVLSYASAGAEGTSDELKVTVR
ncbi:hypothetical protein O2W18_15335 [Modestobacter sp. VKM Ac-2983]|uniref:hypothetical protein n=1 Tax=Modestobacter sp. VKM Ac-2983 TaxID=3004137 RepID=UPI0022AB5114|nr:hypothetical protein [Modestobacter sp. VKM Ac-2983]MCZ2806482.1 hypothetical protein [Modestobacter sp. VKM Ac-2983]